MKELFDRYENLLKEGRTVDASGLRQVIEMHIELLEKENAFLKQDAERYKKQKEFPQIKMDTFEGKYRSHNGFSIFSDWCETYDEAFDLAVVAMQKDKLCK